MENINNKALIEEKEITLLDYVVILVKHSRLIVYLTIAIMVVTLVYLSFFVPNKYTAAARIFPPQPNMNLSSQLLESLSISSAGSSAGASGLGSLAASFLGLRSPGDLYVGILTGNTVFDKIIDKFNLKYHYYKSWNSYFSFSKTPYIETVRKKLDSNVKIETGKDSLITIQVTDENPVVAMDIANAFVTTLDQLLQEISFEDARNQLSFLEKERLQVLKNLTLAEEEMRKFAEGSNVVLIDAQAKGIIEYIVQLRALIDAKEVQIKVIKQQATPFNYDVIRLETEIKELRGKLKAAESQTDECIGNICISSNKFPGLGLEYLRLYREAKYQEKLYELYGKLVEIARLDVARNVPQILFVDKAIKPEKKSKPKRLFLTLLFGLVSFAILIFIVFLLDFYETNQSINENLRLKQIASYMDKWKDDITYLFPKRNKL